MNADDETLSAELDRRLEPYTMATHPGLRHYAQHGMPRAVAQHLAFAYGPINATSPAIMAAGLTQIRDRRLFLVLLRNLWEECGEGDHAQSHTTMFERFMRAVDVPHDAYVLVPGSLGDRLVASFLDVCCKGPEHRALAMLHGFEAVFPHICERIAAALRRGGALADMDDAVFFPFHAVHDQEHARTSRDAMLRSADTDEKRADCLEFAAHGAKLIHDVFDEIFRPAPRARPYG